MPQINLGLQLASLGLPWRQGIELAARLGVRGVEIDARQHLRPQEMTPSALRQIHKQLSDLNLKVCGVSFQTRSGYGHLERLDERVDATKQVMSFAYELGSNLVVNQIGQIPESEEGDEWNLLIEVMTDLGRHAQHCGAFLAAETGTESGPKLARFLEALPTGSLGITLNPGKLVIQRFSPDEAVQKLGPHIMYVRAQDGVRDLAQGRGIEVPLGSGSVDFPSLLGTLEEFNYRGFYTISRSNAQQNAEDLSNAVQFLKNL